MSQSVIQIDAFTDRAFGGNPAAVCLMENPGDEEWMRQVAAEMNLSESAFLYPYEHGYHLRWFTPKAEVDLCGHATLATAHMLYEDGHVSPAEEIHFFTRSGWVSVTTSGNWITMHFPRQDAVEIEPPDGLLEALGVEPLFVGSYKGGVLVQVATEAEVRAVQPDLSRLMSMDHNKNCVTSVAEAADVDFVSRLFAPKIGIDEDPVNGNSHTVLPSFWAGRLGKDNLLAHQASKRGGELRLGLDTDTVHISGRAVTVMRGELID
jgi:PhzF family phenazine biosynthesis protein